MSHVPMPFAVADVSALAKSLRKGLKESAGPDTDATIPSHVEMLNLLARSGGFRNFQHFKAQFDARTTLDAPKPQPVAVDFALVKKCARYFDNQGLFIRWPGKFTHRVLCMWVMWSRLPASRSMNEREISGLLDDQHLFGDHALLRRWLVDEGLVERTPDGRQYRRIERQPPPEAVELIRYCKA